MSKINFPIAIVTASLILGGSYYAVQLDKQESIERLQSIEEERLREKNNLDNQVKCINEADDLRKRISEVRSDYDIIEVHYSANLNKCFAFVLDYNAEIDFYIVYDVLSASEEFQAVVYQNEITGPQQYGPYEKISDIYNAAREVMYAD